MKKRWTAAAVLLVLVAVVAALVWWKGVDHRPRVAAGHQALLDNGDMKPPTAHKVSVRTPTMRLLLSVGDPVDELPPRCCVDTEADHRAPSGGSFLAVHVDEPEIQPVGVAPIVEWKPPHFALVDGEHTYPLDGISRYVGANAWAGNGETEYLALPDKPSHVAITIEYDGVVQRFDTEGDTLDEGVAAPLYHLPSRVESRACAERWSTPYGPRGGAVIVSVARVDVPWLPGLGWARPGRTWLVAGVELDAPYSFTVRGPHEAGTGSADTLYDSYTALMHGANLVPQKVLTVAGRHPRPVQMIGLDGQPMAWDVPAGTHPPIMERFRFGGDLVEGPGAQHVHVVVRGVCR